MLMDQLHISEDLGVFATDGIQMAQGQYISFDKSPGDHRWIVLDITENSLIGKTNQKHWSKIERRATSKVPSVKERFQQILERGIHRHNIHKKMTKLYKAAVNQQKLYPLQMQQYEEIESQLK